MSAIYLKDTPTKELTFTELLELNAKVTDILRQDSGVLVTFTHKPTDTSITINSTHFNQIIKERW